MRCGMLILGKALIYGRSKCLPGPVSLCSEEGFLFQKKESHKGQGLVNKEGVVKLLPYLVLQKKIVTMADIWAGALLCKIQIYMNPVTGHHFW